MGIKCLENYELKKHTTFKIGGCAKRAWFPKTSYEFVELLTTLNNPIVLGGCSNVLISSRGVNNDVILTTEMKSFKIEGTRITADCGVRVPLLSREAQKAGLSGFEFMIGFPGTVGGAVYMNASAHNQFVSDTFVSAQVFDMSTKKLIALQKIDMEFLYRKSILSRKNYVLVNAVFELKQKTPDEVNELMERNIDFRQKRQPNLALPNVGSIFKNPENDSAGRLLELVGAKELAQGGANVWEGHANFIINENNADSKDVSYLMNKMYNMVKDKYRIELEPEVKFIGEKDEEEEKLWDTILKKL